MCTPGPRDRRRATQRSGLAALALIAATLLAHLPALQAGWLWDDDALVLNRLVQSPGGLPGIWAGDAPQEYLPLATSLYWLEFRLWGASAAGFHAVELLLHAGAVLAVWRLLAALLGPGCGDVQRPANAARPADATRPASAPPRPAQPEGLRSAAWWGALLFAVHPIGVACVAWAAETKTMLAVIFAALASRLWLAWLDGEGTPRAPRTLGLSVLCFALALLSKSALVTLPCVLLLLAWWRRGALPRRVLLASAPYFALSLVLGLVTVHVQHTQTLGAGLAGSESLALRAAAAGRAVWWYLGKALLPLDLTVIYPRWEIDAGSVTAWLPLAALVLALALLLRSRQAAARAAGVGLAAYALLLLPALGLIEMSFMAIARVSDHYAYPALVVPCALVATAVARWQAAATARGGVAAGGGRGAGVQAPRDRRGADVVGSSGSAGTVARPRFGTPVILGVAAAVALGTTSYQRARLYRDQATLFGDNVARVPEAWLAHNNLGGALLARGDLAGAEAHLRRAVALHPGYPEPRANLAALLLDTGRRDEARAQLEEALRLAPDLAAAHATLGRVLLQEGRPAEAAAELRRAVALDPAQPDAHNALGVALAQQGTAASPDAGRAAPPDEGTAAPPGAAAATPSVGPAGTAIAPGAGASPTAEQCFRTALALRPDFPEALNNLGRLLLNRAAAPDTPSAARAALLAESEAALRRALALQPAYAAARANLDELLSRPR